MANIAPFKGFTYNYHVRKDFELMVAPPYDVISDDEQEEYYQVDPYNVIRLILGKKKTGDSDWDNRYTRAADYFKRWESAGILLSEDTPCMYLTSLTYIPGNNGPSLTRWGIIALVRIEDEDSTIILPHERTFSAHRDDRLKLMRACNAQFSQVFGLYEDLDNIIMNICRQNIHSDPRIAFELDDGTTHKMWALQSPRLFRKVAAAMKDKSILIADGHHRYETARNFRNIMRARYGRRPANRSYEYVMMYLTNMSDEGLTILPSHRLIKRVPDFQLSSFMEKLAKWFKIEEVPFPGTDISNECTALKKKLEQAGDTDSVIAFYQHQDSRYFLFSLEPGARNEMGDDLHPSLKKLDVLVLSRFIFQKTLGFSKEDLDNEEIFHYQSSMKKAVSDVRAGNYQMAFLLNPTKIGHVKEITGNSLVMPRKSTYFFPKVLTGLVFNKIDPYEIIEAP
jgi:uncharacterized protein (DUF1015 family)